MKKKWQCSFCKRWDKDVWRMVVAPNAGICNACVAIAAQALLDTPKDEVSCVIATYMCVDNTPEGIAEFYAKHDK